MKQRTLSLIVFPVFLFCSAKSQDHYVRIAKIKIDSTQVQAYHEALKEGIKAAFKHEPGVLQLYALADKKHPNLITVFEVYANPAAYQSHIQTPHFKKYKTTVETMVQSLELTDVIPIAMKSKLK